MVNRTNNYFFFALLIGVIILAAYIFLPFFTALIIAGVLAVLCRPFHDRVVKVFGRGKERSSFAAIITLALIVVIIIAPLTLVGIKISSESRALYYTLTTETSRSNLIGALNNASDYVLGGLFGDTFGVSFNNFNITEYLGHALKWSFTNIDSLFSKFASLALGVFLMFLALYYMLRDGKLLKRQLIALSPLADTQDEQIFARLEKAVFSVIQGSLIVGIVQGLLTGIGFAVFGVPNPALWGSIAVITSFIPGFGTALVIIPGVIYLFVTGHNVAGIGMLIWGGVAVGLVDNILGPSLMKRGVHIHPFLILLSVLGGLILFGPIGFIAGPLVISLLFALLDIYKQTIAPAERARVAEDNVGHKVIEVKSI